MANRGCTLIRGIIEYAYHSIAASADSLSDLRLLVENMSGIDESIRMVITKALSSEEALKHAYDFVCAANRAEEHETSTSPLDGLPHTARPPGAS